MRRLAWPLCLGGLLAIGRVAHAEGNCPPGFYPIGNRDVAACAPIPGYGQAQQPYSPQPSPRVVWSDRWGAFALDGEVGALGIATGMIDGESAVEAALGDCKEKGGKDCYPSRPFVNGCGVLIVGARAAYYGYSRTIDEAVNRGVALCRRDGDHDCRLYQAACTPPVRVR